MGGTCFVFTPLIYSPFLIHQGQHIVQYDFAKGNLSIFLICRIMKLYIYSYDRSFSYREQNKWFNSRSLKFWADENILSITDRVCSRFDKLEHLFVISRLFFRAVGQ